jgi:hypothetical protein
MNVCNFFLEKGILSLNGCDLEVKFVFFIYQGLHCQMVFLVWYCDLLFLYL